MVLLDKMKGDPEKVLFSGYYVTHKLLNISLFVIAFYVHQLV